MQYYSLDFCLPSHSISRTKIEFKCAHLVICSYTSRTTTSPAGATYDPCRVRRITLVPEYVKFRKTRVPYWISHSPRISVYAVLLLKIKWFSTKIRVKVSITSFATVDYGFPCRVPSADRQSIIRSTLHRRKINCKLVT